MTWILGLPRWAHALIGLALAAAMALAYVKHRENAAVERDRERAAVEALERAERAQRAADAHSGAIRAANATEAAETRQAMKEAEDANPVEARAAAGPVSRAAAERLRQRQTAKHSPAP